MNVLSKLRNRSLNRALDQFLAEKQASKMPNIQRINSLLIILDESDKSIVKSIENSAKGLFNTNRCGFVILCNEMSDNILQSDLYNEITPKDFGFMSVLKPEKHEYLRKLPSSNMIANMAAKHGHQRLHLLPSQVRFQGQLPTKRLCEDLRLGDRKPESY